MAASFNLFIFDVVCILQNPNYNNFDSKRNNKMPDKKDFYSSLSGMQIIRSKISESVSDNSDHRKYN